MLLLGNAYKAASTYSNKLSFTSTLPDYNGPLFDYQEFLVPLLSDLAFVKGFPKGPIYLLIDDAHFLSEIQTRVLNSWIATRTSGKISIKVSSQYNYKNYYTVNGATIDSPHDYSEIDITTVYTASRNKSTYRDRITKIITRRLELFGIDVSPQDFFPPDEGQEEKIKIIANNYKNEATAGKGRGYYVHDDAYRYARPDFIKGLAGTSKSSASYSYAGLDQLINLSSGVIRHFLEPAHEMYSIEFSKLSEEIKKQIFFISPSVQNTVVRDLANKFLYMDLDDYKKEGHESAVPKDDIEKLFNLIEGLGGLFRHVLLSDRSERRIFSIAISGTPSKEIEKILDIGINLGYFHLSTIGKKDSKSGGRKKLYIMNRRLAPIWTLDPNSFAGYLFVQNSLLEDGVKNPESMLRRINVDETKESEQEYQISLFDFSTTGAELEIIESEDE